MGTPWPLSAPESLVLREGVAGQGTAALKVALLELVGRRVVALTHERRWYGRRTTVAPGARGAPAAGPLAGLARVCLETAARGGGRLDQIVSRHLKAHGGSAQRWLEREVAAGLVDRGLLAAEQRKVLRTFPRTTWTLTPAGAEARADLEKRLEGVGPGLQRTTDPRDALALAAAAGAAVLLVQEAWPLLEDLRRRADGSGGGGTSGAEDDGDGDGRTAGDGEAGAYAGAGGADPGAGELGAVDVGALDAAGVDFGALDGAVDAIDAGVSDGGGGDGGGDGGGGGGD